MALKPPKSRSLTSLKEKICRDIFNVAGECIPALSEEPVKSLRRVFDKFLTDKSVKGAILQQTIKGLQAIETSLQNVAVSFKAAMAVNLL